MQLQPIASLMAQGMIWVDEGLVRKQCLQWTHVLLVWQCLVPAS